MKITNAKDTGISPCTPKAGTYRIVDCQGGIGKIELRPAKCSMRLQKAPESVFRTKKVWESIFDGKGSCRLSYAPTEQYTWWNEEEFVLRQNDTVLYLERIG